MKKILITGLVLSLTSFAVSAEITSADDTPINPDTANQLRPTIWLGSYYSSVYSYIAHGQFTNYLSPRDAGSFLLDFGQNQFRIDLTWAHILTPQQRFKLSAQHFAQTNNFDFMYVPTGESIGQNSVGAEYEYAFAQPWLQLINLHGYYFSANNGDLPAIPFSQGNTPLLDQRNVAGGEGGGFSAGPRWQLWKNAELGLAANYDQVHYPTQSQPAKNSEGFGATVSFTQKISQWIDLEIMATQRQPYAEYTANLTWMVRHRPTSQLGLQVMASHISSDSLPASNNNVIGLSLVYTWDVNTRKSHATPVCFIGDSNCDLARWSSQSAAYVPGVFVQDDEKITPYSPNP